MKTYELMYILDEGQNADGGDAFIKEAEAYISSLGGSVVETSSLGRRTFKHAIGKQRAGNYWTVILKLPPDKVLVLKENYRLNTSVLRIEIFISTQAESVDS